jgi:hypothetical protein
MILSAKNVKKYFCKLLAVAIFAVGFFAFSSHAQAATQVYYSVGQNTTDHKTGTPTVTVAGTTATFSVAQTATNMGVGDLVTYAGGTCYISGKTSATIWSCTNALGASPNAVSNASVTSIAHVFSSLSAALPSGAGGAKTLLGNTNLTAINVQLNIPCYFDTGADTSQTAIQGWTTGQANYVKVYTPTSTATEVNLSQRHSGKWDDQKFSIQVSAAADYARNIMVNGVDFVRIEGLQISVTNNDYNYSVGIYLYLQNNGSEVYVSHNIVRGIFTTTGSDSQNGIFTSPAGSTSKYYIFNNVVYDIASGLSVSGSCIYASDGIVYIHNNTVYNCRSGQQGIRAVSGTTYVKNNLMQQAVWEFSTHYDASSGNNVANGSQNIRDLALGTVAATGTNVGAVSTQINDASANFLNTVHNCNKFKYPSDFECWCNGKPRWIHCLYQ